MYAAVPEVDVDTAGRLLAGGATWIDVREDHEWQDAHVPGTIHAPMGSLAVRLPELVPDPDTTVIVSCLSGARSAHVVAAMCAAGYLDVHNLAGGIMAWRASGRPVEQG